VNIHAGGCDGRRIGCLGACLDWRAMEYSPLNDYAALVLVTALVILVCL
jgi:hypothetical protein